MDNREEWELNKAIMSGLTLHWPALVGTKAKPMGGRLQAKTKAETCPGPILIPVSHFPTRSPSPPPFLPQTDPDPEYCVPNTNILI